MQKNFDMTLAKLHCRPMLSSNDKSMKAIIMVQYIEGASAARTEVFEQAVTRAVEFLNSERWEELAEPLRVFLWDNRLAGYVAQNDETQEFGHCGGGPVFEEAERRILTAELGVEGLEATVGLAQNVVENYKSLLNSFGDGHLAFQLGAGTSWRTMHVIDAAAQRIGEREGTRQGRG